ncbi:hypothetical protein P4O66_017305, partial [Electrophorus voltai]
AGVLNILSANYGRTDSTTCSAGRYSEQITKTDCYGTNTLSEVTNRCEGKSSCVVPAANSVFSDPCYGTYKYLSIKYSCVVHRAGVLNILSANYGRTDSTTCSAGRYSEQITKTDCYGTNTLSEVTNRCDGKSSCVVPATNSVFSDPCYGTYKYLSIKYSCVVHSEFLFYPVPYSSTEIHVCSKSGDKTPPAPKECNGLRQCEFKTDTLGSPDPCNGTDKYYNTTYNCIKGQTSVTCEGDNAVLTCG